MQDVVKAKNEEIQKQADDYDLLNIKYKDLGLELKKLKARNVELSHNHEVVTHRLSEGMSKSATKIMHNFPLFDQLAKKVNAPGILCDETVHNKIGLRISSFFELRDFKKFFGVSKKLKRFFTYNVEVLHMMTSLHAVTNSRYKKKILSMKSKMKSLEDEVARKKKVLYLEHDESKNEIREYLADFMIDDYEPGKKLKDSIDKSCNMVINYSRLSEIEDPIDRIQKEMNKAQDDKNGNNSSAFGILKQSLMSIGNSFGGEDAPKEKLASPKKELNKTSSFNEKEDESKKNKGHRSNGIFDTLFRPLEIKQEEPQKSKFADSSSKPPSGKRANYLAGGKNTHPEIETEDDFFGKNLDKGDAVRRGTIAAPNAGAFFQVSNLSSLEIVTFYRDKPKELMKLFHQIGTKIMNSKDNRGGKWISDIIKNYVSLLLYTTSAIEELEKLNNIKHYFALKIEKTLEEKKDCLKNIEALQEEIKKEQKNTEEMKEEERKARVKLMEKTTEFTVRMNELLNIKEEKDKAVKMAENAEKKLKETKKVRWLECNLFRT